MFFGVVLLFNSVAFNAASEFRIYLDTKQMLMYWIGSVSVDATQIRTSVDGYKTVCALETIYLTCSARNSWSHRWTSPDYVGHNAVIEFNQDYDRPGKGKRVSLPDGRSSLAQMITTDTSTLQITIPGNLNETQITCANDHGDAVIKSFMLSRGKLQYSVMLLYVSYLWAILWSLYLLTRRVSSF